MPLTYCYIIAYLILGVGFWKLFELGGGKILEHYKKQTIKETLILLFIIAVLITCWPLILIFLAIGSICFLIDVLLAWRPFYEEEDKTDHFENGKE